MAVLWMVCLYHKYRYGPDKQKWLAVSLFDAQNQFRGAAIFESKQQAEQYLENYRDKMTARILGHQIRRDEHENDLNYTRTHNYNLQDLKLRVMRLDKLQHCNKNKKE
jgi:hypothetical protein